MPTPDEILKAAQEQEQEAKRKAEHPVSDLRDLRTGLDPESEAEGKAKVEDVPVAPTLKETTDDAPKKRTARKES